MSPKDSDNLSGARFTPASVRRALKGKTLFMWCVKIPQIEFRMAANLRPHLTSSDLTWPGRLTAILGSYQKFLRLSQYTSNPILTGTKVWKDSFDPGGIITGVEDHKVSDERSAWTLWSWPWPWHFQRAPGSAIYSCVTGDVESGQGWYRSRGTETRAGQGWCLAQPSHWGIACMWRS